MASMGEQNQLTQFKKEDKKMNMDYLKDKPIAIL